MMLKRVLVLLSIPCIVIVAAPGIAHAVVHEGLANRCVGDRVIRCVWFNWDETNDKLRAYAVVTDAGDGIDYEVAVNRLRLQLFDPNGEWSDIGDVGTVNTSWNTDHDGWFNNADSAMGALFSCRGLGRFIRIRTFAEFHWSGASTGSEPLGSVDGDENRIPCF